MSWPVCSIADVFDVARGGSPRPIQNYLTDDPGGLNWIMIGDASADSKYIEITKNRIKQEGLKKTRMVKEGDFLLTNSMSFGRPYILKTSGCIHDGWLVLSPKNNQVHPDFFYYLLGSDTLYREFTKRAAGAVVKNLNSDLVRQVQIPLPPLAEQKRIAAILDAADDLRVKRRESLAQLDTLLQSTFLDMFGDPAKNGWEMVTVADVGKEEKGAIRTGPFGSQLLHSEFVDEGIRVLGIDNAVSNTFKEGEPRFITPQKYKKLRRYTVRPGDVLITIMGTCGRCAVVPDDIGDAINTKHLCCISLNRSKCLPEFLHTYFLQHPIARRYLERSAKGAIMSGLNMGIIKAMPIPLPPPALQRRFAAIVDSIEQQKAKQRAHLAELDTLFASLQSRAFRGEL